jgi:peptidoglycan/xylan/chitin deacetylase (PgdA/CDA1 family)
LFAAFCFAQPREVALTFDDLPAVRSLNGADAEQINKTIVAALKRHKAPAAAFVNEGSGLEIGLSRWRRIVGYWARDGHDVGNHTFSHRDFNKLTLAEFEEEVVRGEATSREVLASQGRQLRLFRFPFNHAGDTRPKFEAAARLLKERGYRLAPCTIENVDYEFARAYDIMRQRGDEPARRRLRSEYQEFTSAIVEYYAALNRTVLGREAPHIMLLHANHLNADTIDSILALFEGMGFRFISLERALSDEVYGKPDTLVTRFGPMWGYRWAQERGIKIDARSEPEPPEWIRSYGRQPDPGCSRCERKSSDLRH